MPRKPSSQNGYNVTSGRGNKKSYLLARLRQDHPRILEALVRGEYPSVHAAAIAAGIVHGPSTMTILRRAWIRATAAEKAGFLEFVREGDAAAEADARSAREARKKELERKLIASLSPEDQKALIEEAERQALAGQRRAKK